MMGTSEQVGRCRILFGVIGVALAGGLTAVALEAQTAVPTFTADVAPILQAKCQSCHRPDAIAPMELLTYEDVRRWAPRIRDRVAERKMPPYFIDRHVGIQDFKDDRGLTEDQIGTIVAWVDGGTPRGNPEDMPPPATFEDGAEWTLTRAVGREPDLVIPIPEPFLVPGDGPNWWLDFISETGLTEDRYIQAYETKPTGFAVVHHAISSMFTGDPNNPDWEVGFSEYALGKTGDIFPPNSGQLIKAGTKLNWNIHYSANPNGEDTWDQSSIALWLYPPGEEPKYRLQRGGISAMVQDLDIPPHSEAVRVDGYTVLKDNVRIAIFQPHLHNLGSRQCLEVIYPNGSVQTLSCANWDFGWHIAYTYADEAQPLIPKGSVVHLTSWHNNSESNPWANDPDNWVGWGNRSTDEMAFAHISFYVLSDEEYALAVQERLRQRELLVTQQEEDGGQD
jgi:hypothetical protein